MGTRERLRYTSFFIHLPNHIIIHILHSVAYIGDEPIPRSQAPLCLYSNNIIIIIDVRPLI